VLLILRITLEVPNFLSWPMKMKISIFGALPPKSGKRMKFTKSAAQLKTYQSIVM
jgi:hypothetical protein